MTQTTWLVGATVIDGLGGDPAVGPVKVEDGKITQVGGLVPAGAEVLDCTGMTLAPGLIDAHVHLGMSSGMQGNVTYQLSVAEIAADMFANCAQTLDAGFTTVRDVGGIDAGLADVVAGGKIPGPRILFAGPVLCQTGGHGHLAPVWEPTADWVHHSIPGLRSWSLLSDGPDEMRRNAREAFRRGANFLKLCVTGGVVSYHDKLTDTQFTVDEIAVAVQEAAARGTYVTVHAHNNAGIRNAVEAGALCVEHGSEIDDETAALMAARGVALVPTLAIVEKIVADATQIGLPAEMAERARAVRDGMVNAIHVARRAGLRIGSGSDLIGPDQTYRGEELVLRSKVESPMAALVSATRVNAEVLGLADSIGTIELGKQADIVGFDRNPLDDPALFADRDNVTLVIQNGRIVKDHR